MDRDKMAERLNDMADMIINEEGDRSADATLLYEAAAALSSPCAFCRGLGYIVNPDDLKQVWCYCRDPRPIWSEEEMRHALPGGKP